ncbi:FKBP-type peptidyl-prolyl cis-trans isomerase FkpA [Serratia symbiotica]|nr:FKBP-type peptidyl-prolyl cis-trans isomerase FkpA [Serratia symbiotica]
MKYFYKFILLVTAITLAISSITAMAHDIPKPVGVVMFTDTKSSFSTDKFNNYDDQVAYALGVSLGRYIGHAIKEQEKLGITLDKNQLMAGVQDIFSDKTQLSDADIEKTLQSFEVRLKAAFQSKMEKESQENGAKGLNYRAAFAKEKGVKTTKTGLLYQVEKSGTGAIPKDSDIVVVNYKGTLIDGTEFDNSYARGEPFSFRLDGAMPGWREGLKHAKKGGNIKLVIPPVLAYDKTSVPGIPANSTLVFNVELLDVKASQKGDTKVVTIGDTNTK